MSWLQRAMVAARTDPPGECPRPAYGREAKPSTAAASTSPRLTQPSKLSSRGCDALHISAYIFWDHDPALGAEKVVARALAHEPFAL
ncbi:hypothetical protein ACFYUL_14960 [Streptomyces sp. NPDC004311]|uniref:hypothetical protein n=1 Tax=Streptomyces sp. NPDC004311 TaxID=3364698 RepID=UPI0036783383